MSFLLDIFKGILIGAGAILPGISSGVLCVTLGLYEKIINSLLTFFSDTKKNIKFLFPILLGIIIGIVLFGNVLKSLYFNFPTYSKIFFCILILSSIPSIIKKSNIQEIHFKHILSFLLALSFSIYLVFLENYGYTNYSSNVEFVHLFIAGIFMSAGVVIPGISSTIILMILGLYDTYLVAISSLNYHILIPLGCGIGLGGFCLLIVIKFLFKKYSQLTYSAIIGFVIGSLFILI